MVNVHPKICMRSSSPARSVTCTTPSVEEVVGILQTPDRFCRRESCGKPDPMKHTMSKMSNFYYD